MSNFGIKRLGSTIAAIVALGTTFVLAMTFLPADHSISRAAPAEQKVCRGGTLRISYRDDPSVFDPALSATTIVRFLTFLMYDTLFEYKLPDLQLVPRLAESWEQPNPTTFVIKLRRGVRFHNGLGLRAEDVKFTIDRIRDPKIGSPWFGFFRDIDRMEVVDPWTIRILLKQPSGPLLSFLTQPGTSIVSKAYVEGGGDLKTRPIGTGPFPRASSRASVLFTVRA
jgi:peptide/nickel transport system substrate-binding protein